jgi:hypothetical protein
MTIMYIGDLNQYRVIREMFDAYSRDISSEDCFKTFEEYWNRRIDSPKMDYLYGGAGIKVKLAPIGSYHVPLQLKFTSDEEQTFWLLQNS